MLQPHNHKRLRCNKCGRRSRNTENWLKGSVDDEPFQICDGCLAAEKAAMLTNPNHPAWKTYHALVERLRKSGAL